MQVGYALPSDDRPLQLEVNGNRVEVPQMTNNDGNSFATDGNLHFPRSEDWVDWRLTEPVTITLDAGSNSVTLRTIDSSGGNIDGIHIESCTGSPPSRVFVVECRCLVPECLFIFAATKRSRRDRKPTSVLSQHQCRGPVDIGKRPSERCRVWGELTHSSYFRIKRRCADPWRF